MKKTILATILAVSNFAVASEVSEATSVGTALVISSPTLATVYSIACDISNDCRQIVEAKDDAAEFLATNGEVRSAKLQGALNFLRASDASLKASDLELAEAILAFK